MSRGWIVVTIRFETFFPSHPPPPFFCLSESPKWASPKLVFLWLSPVKDITLEYIAFCGSKERCWSQHLNLNTKCVGCGGRESKVLNPVFELKSKEGDLGTAETVAPCPDTNTTVWIFQLDKMHHPIGSWDSKEHLLQSVGILAEKIKAIQRKFPTWNSAQHLKGRL